MIDDRLIDDVLSRHRDLLEMLIDAPPKKQRLIVRETVSRVTAQRLSNGDYVAGIVFWLVVYRVNYL